MYVEQLYTGCLAEAAYYIESNGEAAIVDPLRETDQYVKLAEARGAKIKYVFETHFHADFVSGHIDLAKKTNSKVVFGPTATTGYDALIAEDNQEFKIGNVTVKVLHTPGHTMESTTYLLLDENGAEHAIFSGDTLFLGDVGRPDLAVKTDLSQADLAGMLFDSLRNKIMTLNDSVTVYPGHGAGSACGKNMSKETVGNLGEQKRTNYALREDMTKEEFIKEVTTGLVTPPQYFPKNVMLNKNGYESFDDVLTKSQKPLTVEEFEMLSEQDDTLILDLRSEQEFVKGFVPGSWFMGLNGSFATWVGTLIENLKQPILLVCPEGKEMEGITRLSRVGYDNVLGYLQGGFDAWKSSNKEIDSIESITPDQFAAKLTTGISVLDVRKASEFNSEHVDNPGVQNFPLCDVHTKLSEVDTSKTYYMHCLGGYRSVITNSILKSKGYNNIIDVAEGFEVIKTKVPVTEFVCPTTLL